MTELTLVILAIPLLLAPMVASDARRGQAMARLLVAVFAVGAIRVATGLTSLGGLAAYAGLDPSNALFVSVTVGILFGALGPWPAPLDRASWATGLPLALGAIFGLVAEIRWLPFGLGGILGALPLFIGLAIPGARRQRDTDLAGAAPGWWLAVTLLLALAEPLLLLALLPVPWLVPGSPRGWPSPTPVRRVLPLVAFVLLLALCWLALTVAGTPWARLDTFASIAPLSLGAERILAVLGLMALIALVAPWPLMRLAPVLVPVPAVVVMAWRMSHTLAPQGIAAWMPVVAMLLVPSAILAALLGYWRTALGTVALVGAVSGGTAGMIGGGMLAIMAVFPSLHVRAGTDRVTFFDVPWRAVWVALGVALVVVALLEVEVVMATILAAGLAVVLARIPRTAPPRIAPDQSA